MTVFGKVNQAKIEKAIETVEKDILNGTPLKKISLCLSTATPTGLFCYFPIVAELNPTLDRSYKFP